MTQKKGRYRGGQGGLAWSCPRDWAGRGSVLPGFPAKDEKKNRLLLQKLLRTVKIRVLVPLPQRTSRSHLSHLAV